MVYEYCSLGNKYGLSIEYLWNVYCIILLLNYKLDKQVQYDEYSLYNNMSSMVMVDIGILQVRG